MPINPELLLSISGILVFTGLIIRFRLKKKELEMRGPDPELGTEVDALRDELDDTRAQLADLQERMELSERSTITGTSPTKLHPRMENGALQIQGARPAPK